MYYLHSWLDVRLARRVFPSHISLVVIGAIWAGFKCRAQIRKIRGKEACGSTRARGPASKLGGLSKE
jgi:hypothetical protein